MTNTQLTVVGKVTQGRMVTVAAVGNNVVGQVRTIHKARPTVTVPHIQEVHTYESIDSPFISIVQANSKRLRAEKQARIEAIAIQNKRNNRINMIKNLFR